MSCFTINYENGAKKMRPVLTEAEYRALRGSEKQRSLVSACRRGYSHAKNHLIQMNYSCIPGEDMLLKGCKTPSDCVGMDVDFDPTDPDYEQKMAGVPAMVLSKKDELGLLMLERSANKGFHLVFRRRPELLQEENLAWASELLGVAFDAGAKDITRVFYTTTNDADDLLYLSPNLFEINSCCEPPVVNKPAVPEVITKLSTEEKEVINNRMELSTTLDYNGIPYRSIIDKWWELYNGGQTPVKSNRDVLTFELAVNLRHICGFDREMMSQLIPCYDGFSEAQKMKCIDSALAEKRTQMPKRMKEVLEAVQRDLLTDVANEKSTDIINALDAANAQDELYHYDRLPKLPQGVRDSVDAAGHTLAMPTLIAIAPAIGALATGVKLDVHGKAKGLNLCSFIVGEFASGKGQMDDIIGAWMTELQAQADIYNQQEEEWASKAKRMKSGKAPEQPKLPVRMLTLNNTVANIADRLANTQGKHSFSFTPEADNVALKWKQSVSDFSVMLRQAYDEARYDREAKSADAVRVHIPKLLWNVTMCGTQDALYRVITNYTDGLLSRLAIARTPDNTFAPLADHPASMSEMQSERIQQIAHLLPLMEGEVVLHKLEERGRQWLEGIRLEAMKNDDRILARQRMRGCVNAQRITTALWLPKVAESLIKKFGMNGAETRLRQNPELWIEMLKKMETEEMMQLFDLIADYLIENDLYYFRDRIETAYESKNYQTSVSVVRARRGKNDSIYERLADEFSFEQAFQQTIAVKGNSATRNSVHQMLKNWRSQGLIIFLENLHYHKANG